MNNQLGWVSHLTTDSRWQWGCIAVLFFCCMWTETMRVHEAESYDQQIALIKEKIVQVKVDAINERIKSMMKIRDQ